MRHFKTAVVGQPPNKNNSPEQRRVFPQPGPSDQTKGAEVLREKMARKNEAPSVCRGFKAQLPEVPRERSRPSNSTPKRETRNRKCRDPVLGCGSLFWKLPEIAEAKETLTPAPLRPA